MFLISDLLSEIQTLHRHTSNHLLLQTDSVHGVKFHIVVFLFQHFALW
jgi:hypothetical protein